MIASGFRLDDEPSGIGVLRFAVVGELDAYAASRLVMDVERRLDPDVRAVHLTMEDLEFVDSAGLRALARLDQRLRSADRRLVLERPTDAVRRVLRIADLDGHFEVAP